MSCRCCDLFACASRSPPPTRTPSRDQVKYGPATLRCAGEPLAVLEGDPTASSGDFTIRLKMPDGYKIALTFIPSAKT